MDEVNGTVAPGFERVREVFEANFTVGGDVGAACTVWVGGHEVVDLVGGLVSPASDEPYTRRALQMVASATNGAMAICALRLVERGELDLDAPVATYWPEFAAAGKAEVPVRWLLTHQAGLPHVDPVIAMDDVYRWTPMVEALAAQAPVWEPGTRTATTLIYGWLVGEVLARVTGLNRASSCARRSRSRSASTCTSACRSPKWTVWRHWCWRRRPRRARRRTRWPR
ncbi:serine hydrolase domain-containing protein [Actinophytocola sp.]|uniref:serine hydrolase domain-containing protein n=1 Tax=Actinophytocola sp. TaxID=1872138 RepID=UPI003D6A3151